MRNIKLTIEYDGQRYDGWVKAVAGTSHKNGSVSEKISEVLRQMEEEEVNLIGAARTESGVHAYAQVATFKTNSRKKPIEIKQYLNRYLPRDIAVLDVVDVDERFHPAFNAKSFEYEYKVTVGEVPSVFDRKYNYYCFRNLDCEAMQAAADKMIGKHDFKGFSDNKRMKKSTEREVYSFDVYKSGNEISFSICADDFWPNMVRIIIALLIEIGSGEKGIEVVDKILESRDRALAPEAIDPKGLFLSNIEY